MVFGPPPARAGLQDIELARISQEATERFYKLAVRRALQGERMRRLHRLRRTIRPAHQRDFGRNARSRRKRVAGTRAQAAATDTTGLRL
jgi:hypothetical protein